MRVFLLLLLLLEVGFAKKLALVIGNSNYTKGYLPNPINDAQLIRNILHSQLGFDVIYKTDLSKYQMEKEIRSFSSSIGSRDIALFYYAGHGMQYNRLNYLIPLKANAVTEGQIPSVGVDVNYILGGMNGAKLAIVLLDACRNNPFSRSFSRGGTRGLAQVNINQGNYIISYATEAGAETQDGNGVNSPYALALQEFLPQPLEISRLLKMVKNRVAGNTNPQQIPYVDDHYIGEYTLSGGGGSCTKVVRVPATYKSVKEKVLVGGNGVKKVAVPATYKKIKRKVQTKPTYKIYKWIEGNIERTIEPKFYQTTERVLASKASERIEIDANNQIKRIPIFATYKTITPYKLEKEADLSKIPSNIKYQVITIPPRYRTVTQQVVVTPATVKTISVSPTYQTVAKKVLLTPETTKNISVPCSEVN